jgi:glycerol-3-phosphate O-acyltransferase
MKWITWLRRLLVGLVRWPLVWWVKPNRIPEDPVAELGLDPDKPILYVLGAPSSTNLAILKQQCELLGLPSPVGRLCSDCDEPSYLFIKGRGWFSRAKQKRHEKRLRHLTAYLLEHPDSNIQVVPVALYWGRAPSRGSSLWRVIFSDVEDASRLRKFFIVLFQRRHTFIQFSKPVDLSQVLRKDRPVETNARTLARLFRVHFHRRRLAAQGRQVANKKQLMHAVLGSDMVRRAIRREAEVSKISLKEAQKKARKYFNEIAADYSFTVVRFLDMILTRLWNKIYDGIAVYHGERVRQLAETHEMIYVPCHRSHMDYLLLGYTLYHQGLVPPHIAAGINLNFWPVGGILRRGGAFFIRRSFRGNKLYSAVFHEYLYQLFARNVAVKFFPEGGRSRTGRLLPPKTGMMAMTVQSAIRGVRKPIALVPVYLGYERILEGNSYLGELQGQAKQSESVGQLLGVRKALKRSYGRAFVNFGDPVVVTDFLDAHQPDWTDIRKQAQESGKDVTELRPAWLNPLVRRLADTMMTRINEAAVVNSINLVSTVLLATERHVIDRPLMERQLGVYADLLNALHYSDNVQIAAGNGPELLKDAEQLGMVSSVSHAMGELLYAEHKEAVLMTYYRNNTLHLFAPAGFLAACFTRQECLTEADIESRARSLFPILANELFLHGDADRFWGDIQTMIPVLLEHGWLQRRGAELVRCKSEALEFEQLRLLAQTVQPVLERFKIMASLVIRQPGLSRSQLERQSQLVAQRLSYLHKINAPEFFDKALFSTMLQTLREEGWLEDDSSGGLLPTDTLRSLQDVARSMVRYRITQAIRQSLEVLEQRLDE